MNLQNIPRDDPLIKAAFVPDLDLFVEFDYSQIEPRLLAYFSEKLGDSQLADVYRKGEDVYLVTAGAILNKDPSKVTPHERQLYGKTVFLSIIYGAGPKKISEAYDLTMEQARKFYKNFHENLPCVRMLSNPPPRQSYAGYEPGAIERVLKRKGYIETMWGRPLKPGRWEEHKMINKLIQGSAADLMKQSLVNIHEWWETRGGITSRFGLTVHDSILWDALSGEVALLRDHVPGLMDEPRLSDVLPIEVEMKTSTTTWADMALYEEE